MLYNYYSVYHDVSSSGQGGRSEWVGCVGVDSGGEWIVCGGSEAPSIYHLSTLSHVTTLATPPGVITQSILFTNDRVS